MLIDNGGRKVFVRRNTFFLLLILLATAVLRIVEIIRLPSIWHRDEIFSVVYALNSFGGDLNPHDSTKPSLHYVFVGGCIRNSLPTANGFRVVGIVFSLSHLILLLGIRFFSSYRQADQQQVWARHLVSCLPDSKRAGCMELLYCSPVYFCMLDRAHWRA